LGDVLGFMRLLWALDHALHKRSKRMTKTAGVTGPQRLVIRIVTRFPGITAGQIAALLHVHPSTLTGVLGRLERKGLVRRRPDERDARRALFGSTPRGRSVDAASQGTVESAVASVLARTPKARIRAARTVLAELARSLEED
jgi:DNA-binding MarR family transcriptional regulator